VSLIQSVLLLSAVLLVVVGRIVCFLSAPHLDQPASFTPFSSNRRERATVPYPAASNL
jgi:hypothetical protein